jgi:hypothetical protein
MEKENLKKIIKNYKWYEKIQIKLLEKLILKLYHNIRIEIVNTIIEK